MSIQVELSEMEATRGEKFLAFVLAVFLLIGGLWLYFRPLDLNEGIDPYESAQQAQQSPQHSADLALLRRQDALLRRSYRARAAARSARDRLEVRREAYRTALEAGGPAGSLQRQYERAQTQFKRVGERVVASRAAARANAPAAARARQRLDAADRASARKAEADRRTTDRETFVVRLIYVLLTLAVAFWLFNRQRRMASRYLALGMAAVGFAAAQALVMAADYTTDYIDITQSGPLVLSLVGIALTTAAFVGLQRYLARRLPRRRVRRGECPFCGFPARGEHCEGCGRSILASCATCEQPRRVGTPFCGACGNA
ncbi:MAG: zinc ribbon domain-containing protein [Thermoleophilaceae bacterium]